MGREGVRERARHAQCAVGLLPPSSQGDSPWFLCCGAARHDPTNVALDRRVATILCLLTKVHLGGEGGRELGREGTRHYL